MSEHPGHYPRVLIVGHDFAPNTGDQVTLSSLFKGWPRDHIAVAAEGPRIGTSGFAGHYYRLGALEDRWVWPLSLVPRESWKVSGATVPAVSSGRVPGTSPLDGHPPRRGRSRRHPGSLIRHGGSAVLRAAGANELFKGPHVSDGFLAWIDEFRPDVVYTQLSTLGLVRLTTELIEKRRIPLAIHFMDDWPSTVYRRLLLGPLLRRKILPELEDLIREAAVLMAISEAMAAEFEARYGRAFHSFHNALDLGVWKEVRRTSWKVGRPLDVLYAGRIGGANLSSLVDVAKAVGCLVQEGRSIRLTLLSHDAGDPMVARLKGLAHVDVLPAIPHADIPARLAAADVLLLPLDFGKRAEKFTRFSMPSKASEYMASGTPIIVYAPAVNAVSRYAISEGWGLVVGQRSVDELVQALRSLATSVEERERLGRRAVEVAFARHDADVVSEAFRRDLESAAVTRRST